MHTTLTDWQGRLRVGDVVAASLRWLVRHPISTILVPGLAGACIFEWVVPQIPYILHLHVALDGFEPWSRIWLDETPAVLAVLVGLVVAWASDRSAPSVMASLRRHVGCGLLALGAWIVIALAGMLTGPGALFAFGCIALMVPALGAGTGSPLRAMRRGLALGDGSRVRLVVACVLLQLVVFMALGLLVNVAWIVAFSFVSFDGFDWLRWWELAGDRRWWWLGIELVAMAVPIGLAVGALATPLAIAHRRLSRAKPALDPEAWEAVFR